MIKLLTFEISFYVYINKQLFLFKEPVAHTKAQLLSRRVWDILQAVPLNPTLLEAFQNPSENKLPELLDPTSPQKLMYSLHIIDKLSSNNGSSIKDSTGTLDKTEEKVCVENWNELFIKKGGLRLLYDIMMSGAIDNKDQICHVLYLLIKIAHKMNVV